MSAELTKQETWSLLGLSAGCIAIIANTFQGDGEPLIASLSFSGLAFAASYSMIRWLGPVFVKAGLKGKDMSKVKKVEIPEGMGAICAIVYLLVIIFFIPFPFYKDIVEATSGGGLRDEVLHVEHVDLGRHLHRFPHSKLASYLSCILTLQSITLLGIIDDLFDLRWRHKVLIPAFAAIPLLIVYFVDFGVTTVVIPKPLRPYLLPSADSAPLFDLSYLYYMYMAVISIFAPNSINILAGVNGIEVSQSIVVTLLIIINSSLYLLPSPFGFSPHPAEETHLLTLYLLLPFLGVSLALWYHNWYPARVFVGDTYCYFAGMVFAVVGISGHFSKTLLLLLIPQIFNALYSLPQLFHIIPCPRHRLPRFNARTGLLEPSVTQWERPPRPVIALALNILEKLYLIRLEKNPKGEIITSSNFTILNLWLVWFGPMREDRLAMSILAMQMGVGVAGLIVRHKMGRWVFGLDNRGSLPI
ncbi:tunicamycin resistance protein [Mycoblastus sanguinarius]|nr:tunicamycin resistance protein [Mycoblastus sanguinarius]